MPAKKHLSLLLASLFAASASVAHASVDLIAIGSLSGAYEDLATETAAALDNGAPGNRLGGIGSGLAWAGGTTFLALPDRGPNATAYNAAVSDTASYIVRFQTFNLSLAPAAAGAALPFVLTPTLRDTTLLSSRTPLVYGSGAGLGLGSGAPALNAAYRTHYFTGRADNFDPAQPSTNPKNARLDPEGIRVSNDGKSVYISDEYGPYVYEFDRRSGERTKAYKLPNELAVSNLSANGDVEIGGNTVGRVANKGMEGLAITPDGKMLVGMMQAPLEQDTNKSVRIVTIDIKSGAVKQYAYKLTDGSGVSEILAINNHEFLVDERDGKGLGDNSSAAVKKLFRIDLAGATDVSGKSGDLSAFAVPKTPFLDVVAKLTGAGFGAKDIPAKIEGMAFGQDVVIGGVAKHTLYVVNDNDFVDRVVDGNHPQGIDNPNRFFVFAFDDADLPGLIAQKIKDRPNLVCELEN
jgi:hypothetical protein